MTDRDVRVVAFDVNETLFSLDSLGLVFATVGLNPATVPLWFARLLRDGFALTAMGQYRPFGDLAAQTLRAMDPDKIDDAAVAAVLGAFRQLDPHPDVEPALRMLHDAGIPAVTLTNGSADLVGALLNRAGLHGLVRRSLSVDDIRRWKPAPEPYLWAAQQLGAGPGQVALVASHPWDCAGAHTAGLTSGWVNRAGAAWPTVFPPPDAVGRDLTAVVTGLLDADQPRQR
jgi:2-haloacid dehalogenase